MTPPSARAAALAARRAGRRDWEENNTSSSAGILMHGAEGAEGEELLGLELEPVWHAQYSDLFEPDEDLKESQQQLKAVQEELNSSMRKSQELGKEVQQMRSRIRELCVNMKSWLQEVEGEAPVHYAKVFEENYDSVGQLLAVYLKGGEFNTHQWAEDAGGVSRVGHKRVFEKWFKDFLADEGGGQGSNVQ